MTRAAVLSFDHLHSPRFLAVLANHPRVELVAVADEGVNSAVARRAADGLDIPFLDSYRELLRRDDVDWVYVGTTPADHLRIVGEAAAAGIDVLCDKPIAPTLGEADAIVELAAGAAVKLMIPFYPRFQLPVQKVKQLLNEGEAGELVAVYALKYGRLPTTSPGPQDAEWFLDPAIAGGGGFMDIGIHAVDAFLWLAESPPVAVYAQIGNLVHSDLGTDDLGSVTIEFANGVIGVLSAGWANPTTSPAWLDVRFEILTTTDAFLIDRPYHDFTVVTGAGVQRRPWWRRDISGIVDEFVAALEEDRNPAPSGEDGRAALAVVAAAYESARTGGIVRPEG